MKFILGALAAVAIAGVAFVQPAEARCFWNGFETVCVHHGFGPYGGGFYRHHWYRDYDRPYYRSWY